MLKTRNRLLVTLVLLLLATATAWTVAEARPKSDDGSSSGTVAAPGIPKPCAAPASGEPDQPAGHTTPGNHGAVMAPPSQEGSVAVQDVSWRWIRWISRIWAARYLGVAF